MKIWSRLTPEEKENILKQIFQEGKSHKEVAEDIGISEDSINNLLRQYAKSIGVLSNSSLFWNTPSELAKKMFYYVIATGHYYCDDNFYVKRDRLDSYQIMYIVNGQGTIELNDKTYKACKGDIVLLDCYKPHMYTTNKWEALWMHFDGNVSREYVYLLSERFDCVFPSGNTVTIPKLLRRIISSFASGKMIKEPVLSSYIEQILAELFVLSSKYESKINEQESVIDKALDFINNNFCKQIPLEQIAKRAAISKYHFIRTFKKETGHTPHNYIINLRINKAKSLLITSGLQIKAIAFESGFKSEAHFIQTFINRTGMSPSIFRQRHINF